MTPPASLFVHGLAIFSDASVSGDGLDQELRFGCGGSLSWGFAFVGVPGQYFSLITNTARNQQPHMPETCRNVSFYIPAFCFTRKRLQRYSFSSCFGESQDSVAITPDPESDSQSTASVIEQPPIQHTLSIWSVEKRVSELFMATYCSYVVCLSVLTLCV